MFSLVVATNWVWQNWVSSALFLIILYLILIYSYVVQRARLDERPTIPRYFSFWCFHYVVATNWVWQNSVSSDLFLIILCLILIYSYVVLRARLDEGPTTPCYFAFWCFHYVVATNWVWQNLVSSALFLIILYLILIYLYIVWRALWDERPTMCCYFALGGRGPALCVANTRSFFVIKVFKILV
jgi:hypothetical protein